MPITPTPLAARRLWRIMTTPTPTLSIVAPCHNEELVLDEFLRRITAVIATAAPSCEIVLIDDGSTDATWPRMLQLASQNPSIVCIKLSRNHGHQLALSAGLAVCTGQRTLIIDADLQDPPELLPQMMQLMDQGNDVVYGQRRQRLGENILKRSTASLFYRLINRLAERPIPLDTGDFRLISRRALDILNAMPESHRFIRGMISWIGFKQTPLLYDRDPRFAGITHYSFAKMLRLAIDGVTALSIKPLQVASWIGVCTGVLAIALVIYSVIGWLTGNVQAGWTSLMAAIAFLSSVQLFVLGILGEYLGRLYEQSKGRPLYVIEQIVRNEISTATVRERHPTTVPVGSPPTT
jgi:polyisoprenyl-phosphate glycosyltransferase